MFFCLKVKKKYAGSSHTGTYAGCQVMLLPLRGGGVIGVSDNVAQCCIMGKHHLQREEEEVKQKGPSQLQQFFFA